MNRPTVFFFSFILQTTTFLALPASADLEDWKKSLGYPTRMASCAAALFIAGWDHIQEGSESLVSHLPQSLTEARLFATYAMRLRRELPESENATQSRTQAMDELLMSLEKEGGLSSSRPTFRRLRAHLTAVGGVVRWRLIVRQDDVVQWSAQLGSGRTLEIHSNHGLNHRASSGSQTLSRVLKNLGQAPGFRPSEVTSHARSYARELVTEYALSNHFFSLRFLKDDRTEAKLVYKNGRVLASFLEQTD